MKKHNTKRWTSAETKFITSNCGKMTQREIARTLGRTLSSVSGKMTYLGLSNRLTSLCWSCNNGYAHRCSWVSDSKPCWEKSIEGRDGEDVFNIVTECKFYVREKRH